ncbi:MAG: hypothetical protein RLZZ258_52 [Actinomycetota bacterium]|jgi:hypothetical protein
MSKNTSRKGIAFGVAATVGFAGLTGVLPAQAAELVTLSPIAGTSYNVPLDETFTLKTYFGAAAQNATTDKLKVRIVDADEALDFGSSTLKINEAAPAAVLSDLVDGVSITDVDNVAGVASVDEISLVPGALTEKASVTVQTWVDANGDDIVDGDEAKSGVRTINFLGKDDIKASIAIADSTDFDSTDAEAKVVFSPALNLNLFADEENILDLGYLGVEMSGNAATLELNSDGSVTATDSNAVLEESYVVEALFDGNSIGKSTKVVVDHDVVTNADALVGLKNNNVTADGAVRTGTKNVDAVLTVENSEGDAVGAGVLVRVFAEANLIDPAGTKPAETIKVNGKLVDASDDLAFNVFTDANGQVKLPVVASSGYADSSVHIYAEAEGTEIDDLLFTWQDAEYETISSADKSGSYDRSITEGGSTSLTFEVKDQFGVAIGSGARVHFTIDGSDSDLVDSWVTLVGGKAAVKVADTTADESTSYEIDGELEIQATNGNYETTDVWISNDDYYYVNVAETATKFDELNDDDEFEVTVANADVAVESTTSTVSVNNPGAPITISSKGVTFTINEVEYADTVTVFSDSDGDVAFKASSKVAGEHTIAFTAGADSGSSIFEVNPAAADSGVKLTLSAPAKVAPGGVLAVVGTLTDKYGNPVFTDGEELVSFTYKDSGLGIAIAGNSVSDTDENGKFTLRYSIAANQSGTAVVTVKYDADLGDDTNKILSASKTVRINKSSTASASAGSKKITVRAKNSLGETVKVYVDGVLKSTKVATSNNYAITVSGLTAGKHTVKVLVSGKSVLNTRVVATK